MGKYKFLLHAANKRKDGTYPVSLRITKGRKCKYISTQYYATPEQWDEKQGRFVSSKRVVCEYRVKNARISELDIKFVKAFDVFLQKRECSGNTRKYYFKALRACMNKAIQDGEASESTYPFGKGGFNISSLEEETAKRYLPTDSLSKIKDTVSVKPLLEQTRRVFLFSYYCYGISFIDAAMLTKENIVRHDGGSYIVYKRNKSRESKIVQSKTIKHHIYCSTKIKNYVFIAVESAKTH